jgi:hypothetical protein
MNIQRLVVIGAATLACLLGAGSAAVSAASIPSGQRSLGQSIVEPVYDGDHAGDIDFVATPQGASPSPSASATAPLYLPVYPTGSTVGALICPHLPIDTCPDHGPGIAALAQASRPATYGNGVLGHDHLATSVGSPGFNVTLEPIVVLFTSTAAANEHLLTTAQIDAAVARGDAITVPLPGATLHAEHVPLRVWTLATPLT